MDRIFFDGWMGPLRILIIGVLAYVAVLVLLRISGKRTLSKMNAFDFVVTIALGSTLATAILSKDVPLLDGALAFAVLIAMQFLITWSSVRTSWVRRVVTGEPHLLLYRGDFLDEPMRGTRITKDEVFSAIRSAGLTALDEVEAVVLETDGSFSVIRRSSDGGVATLEGVIKPDRLEQRLKH